MSKFKVGDRVAWTNTGTLLGVVGEVWSDVGLVIVTDRSGRKWRTDELWLEPALQLLPTWYPPIPGSVLEDRDRGRGVVGDNASVYWQDGGVEVDFADLEEDVIRGTVVLLFA